MSFQKYELNQAQTAELPKDSQVLKLRTLAKDLKDATPFTPSWFQVTSSLIALARESQRECLSTATYSESPTLETRVLHALESEWRAQDSFGVAFERALCSSGTSNPRSDTLYTSSSSSSFYDMGKLNLLRDSLTPSKALGKHTTHLGEREQSLLTSDATAPLIEGSQGRVASSHKTLWDQPLEATSRRDGLKDSTSVPDLTVRAIVEEGKMDVVIRLWLSLRRIMSRNPKQLSSKFCRVPGQENSQPENPSINESSSSSSASSGMGHHGDRSKGESKIEASSEVSGQSNAELAAEASLLKEMMELVGQGVTSAAPTTRVPNETFAGGPRLRPFKGPGPRSLRHACQFLHLILRISCAEQSCCVLIHRFMQYSELVRLLDLPVLLLACKLGLQEGLCIQNWVQQKYLQRDPDKKNCIPTISLLSKLRMVLPAILDDVRSKLELRTSSIQRIRKFKHMKLEESHEQEQNTSNPQRKLKPGGYGNVKPNSSINDAQSYDYSKTRSSTIKHKKSASNVDEILPLDQLKLQKVKEEMLQSQQSPNTFYRTRGLDPSEPLMSEIASESLEEFSPQPPSDCLVPEENSRWTSMTEDLIEYIDDDADPAAYTLSLVCPSSLEKLDKIFANHGNVYDPSASFSVALVSCPMFFTVRSTIDRVSNGSALPVLNAIRSLEEECKRIRKRREEILKFLQECHDRDTSIMLMDIYNLHQRHESRGTSHSSIHLLSNLTDIKVCSFQPFSRTNERYLIELASLKPLFRLTKKLSPEDPLYWKRRKSDASQLANRKSISIVYRCETENNHEVSTSSSLASSLISSTSTSLDSTFSLSAIDNLRQVWDTVCTGLHVDASPSVVLFLSLLGSHIRELRSSDSSSTSQQHSLLVDVPVRQIIESEIISDLLLSLSSQTKNNAVFGETRPGVLATVKSVSSTDCNLFGYFSDKDGNYLSARSRLLGMSFVSALISAEVGTVYFPTIRDGDSAKNHSFLGRPNEMEHFVAIVDSVRDSIPKEATHAKEKSDISTLSNSSTVSDHDTFLHQVIPGRTSISKAVERKVANAGEHSSIEAYREKKSGLSSSTDPSRLSPSVSMNNKRDSDMDHDDEFDVLDIPPSVLPPKVISTSVFSVNPHHVSDQANNLGADCNRSSISQNPNSLDIRWSKESNMETSQSAPEDFDSHKNKDHECTHELEKKSEAERKLSSLVRFQDLVFLPRLTRFLDYLELTKRTSINKICYDASPSSSLHSSQPSLAASRLNEAITSNKPINDDAPSRQRLSVLQKVRLAGEEYFRNQ